MHSFIHKKYTTFFLILFLSGLLLDGCASLSHNKGDDDFQSQFNEYQGYVRAGKTSLNRQDYIEAIDQYSRAIKISPFAATHYYNRGLAWYRKGNWGKATDDFDKALLINTNMRYAYVYRGLCKVKVGEYKEALSDYKKAIKLNPKDGSLHNNLSWLYATAKDEKFRDKGKALKHAKKAAELSKERNADILDTLAQAYFINGRIKEAVDTENKALNLEPNNEEFKAKKEKYAKAMDDKR